MSHGANDSAAEHPAGREALVAALHELGVDYLGPGDARRGAPLGAETLIARLAGHPDRGLRLALIALFLLHPELARAVPGLAARLGEAGRRELVAGYTAAACLQRMWSLRLGHYLGRHPELPDHFSGELGIPAPDERYGKSGLEALAAWYAGQVPDGPDVLAEYQGVAARVLDGLKRKHFSGKPVGES